MGEFNNGAAIAITTDGAAKAIGDCVGGLITVPVSANGLLTDVRIIEDGTVAAAFTVWVFNEAPTSIADNAALNLSIADKKKCIGLFTVATGDYVTNDGDRMAFKSGLNIPFDADSNNQIYIYLQATGTPTIGATALSLAVSYMQGGSWLS